jgi:hypothetical protein
MKKIVLIASVFIITSLFFLWYFYLYDVPVSASFFRHVCKDFSLNLASLAKNQKKPDKVCRGVNGWLFYEKEISAVLLRWRFNANNAKILSNLSSVLKEKGIQVVIVPVPNKIDIYPETYLPEYASNTVRRKRSSFFNLFSNTQTAIVDCYPTFINEKKSHLLYYKTDTHWNSEAKKIACEAIVSSLQPVTFQKHLSSRIRITDTIICHSTDLLNTMIGDTVATSSPMTCVLDSAGMPLSKVKNSEVIIIGDSFSMNDERYGADIGSLLAYRLNTPVGNFYTINIESDLFIPFVKQTLAKLKQQPKIVIILFTSRRLLLKLKY